MRRKKERKCFVQYMPNLLKHHKFKLFINVYNAAHEMLKLPWSGWLPIFENHMFYLLPEYHIYDSFQGVDEEY